MRLLLDEMISPRIARALRAEGRDVAAVAEDANLRTLPDDVLLEAATAAERALVTRNIADFARLHHQWHREGKGHHGLVMVTQQMFPQDRSFIGALTASLRNIDEVSSPLTKGEVLFLRNVRAD